MNLGFVGLGRMGGAMAARLVAAGHDVTAWNRSPGPVERLAALGAGRADTPARVVRDADTIITIISDDAAAERVYLGEDGLFFPPLPGKLFIDMSTLRPDTMRDLAARARDAGSAFLDAPVLGTVAPAGKGQLVALVGGQAEDIARARPVFDVLCREVIHAGPAGSGALLKLVANLPLGVYWQALAEAVAMGRAGGLSLDLILEAVGQSGGALAALKLKGEAIRDPQAHVAFDVDSMIKDLGYIVETAERFGVSVTTARDSLARYRSVAEGGKGAADAVAIVTEEGPKRGGER